MTEKIIEILREINPYERINEETRLVESGILDSLTILSLVTLLEEEFEIEIADDAVTRENFSAVPLIVSLVEKSKKLNEKNQ